MQNIEKQADTTIQEENDELFEENDPAILSEKEETSVAVIPNTEDDHVAKLKNRLAFEMLKKNEYLTAILNMFIAGLGHFYCGKPIKAVITFGSVILIAIACFIVNILSGGIGIIVTLPLSMIIAVVLFISGFLTAKATNKKLEEECMASAYQVDMNYWTVQRLN